MTNELTDLDKERIRVIREIEEAKRKAAAASTREAAITLFRGEKRRIMTSTSPGFHSLFACACMGPQDGDPECPCIMRYSVIVYAGRYILADSRVESEVGRDLGSALR